MLANCLDCYRFLDTGKSDVNTGQLSGLLSFGGLVVVFNPVGGGVGVRNVIGGSATTGSIAATSVGTDVGVGTVGVGIRPGMFTGVVVRKEDKRSVICNSECVGGRL
jgi:hypothetical protein